MKKYLFVVFGFIVCVTTQAQSQRMYKYVVFFADKDTLAHHPAKPETFLSAKAITRKKEQRIAIDATDLPVTPAYLDAISKDTDFTVHNTSRWFNCAVIFTTRKDAVASLQTMKGVRQVMDVGYSTVRKSKPSPVNLDAMIASLEQKFVRRNRKETDTNIYGAGLSQAAMLNVPQLHKIGLNGYTTTIAIIDAGFSKANTHKVFANTLKNVMATYDFVDMEQNVFNDDDHGTAVWSCIGASDSFNFVGTAPSAKYILLRSEDAPTEFPVEEFYWAIAAEFADSMGVDLISSSLGYNEFGDARYNYTQKHLNGKTAWITKAATLASQKGILVVNSGGNEGDNMWKQITFPADADEVISVGAVDKNDHLSDFSSLGLTADKRIKPNLVAMGESVAIASELGNVYTGNGTSYSCPILAGGIACLWPELKKHAQADIKNILQLSASNYYKPNKYFGYGIPD
ncbi:MAG: S8 family serine peptidase, partial [Bacteroidota bacterium]